jgi:hypothetical protein
MTQKVRKVTNSDTNMKMDFVFSMLYSAAAAPAAVD